MSQDTDQIRTLNDIFRKNLCHGRAFMTPGIAALGADAVKRLITTIAIDDFCVANDPHEEHDFGTFRFDDEVDVIFKIDYYDKQLEYGSPDPADPAVTERVITLMLSEEY
jgi:hypothetical protein